MFLYIVLGALSLLVFYIVFKKPQKRISNVDEKYVLITGCDSGFGRETAICLDSLGFNVFATCLTDDGEKSLRTSCSKKLDVIRLNVTDTSQVKAAYDYVRENMSSEEVLWAVINNAGIVKVAPLDWQSIDEMKKIADVNLWGLIDVTKTFLPLLKKSQGRLVNIASIGGRLSFPFIGAYCTAKFGVEGFTDALRRELCCWNMKIILVEPGFHKTNMTGRKNMADQWDKSWEELPEEKKMEYGEDFFNKSKENFLTGVVDTCVSPKTEHVTNAIVDAVTLVNPKLRYLVGWDANVIWVWLSMLPTKMGDAVVNWIAKIPKVVPAQIGVDKKIGKT